MTHFQWTIFRKQVSMQDMNNCLKRHILATGAAGQLGGEF